MQTSIAGRMPIGVAGMLANFNDMADARVNSVTSEEASALIPFGVMLCRGTTEKDAKLLNTSAAAMAAGQLLVGVSVWANSFVTPQEIDEATGYLKPGTTFGVLFQGEVLVQVEENVTPASDVRVRVIAVGNEVKGAFRATADATDCVDITPLARYMESATAGNLCRVYIDMGNVALATADA